MPLVVLFALALTVGLTAGLTTWRYPRFVKTAAAPASETARQFGETVGRHRSLRAVMHARLDPAVATGLALTLALVFAVGGGVLFGVLAYLVRANSHLVGIDNGVAKWGNRHASAMSTHVLDVITQLGGIYLVIVLCVVLAVAETIRERSVWVAPFIVLLDVHWVTDVIAGLALGWAWFAVCAIAFGGRILRFGAAAETAARAADETKAAEAGSGRAERRPVISARSRDTSS